MAINNTGTNDINQSQAAASLEQQASNPASANPSGPINNAGFAELDQLAKAQAIKNRALSEPSKHNN